MQNCDFGVKGYHKGGKDHSMQSQAGLVLKKGVQGLQLLQWIHANGHFWRKLLKSMKQKNKRRIE